LAQTKPALQRPHLNRLATLGTFSAPPAEKVIEPLLIKRTVTQPHEIGFVVDR